MGMKWETFHCDFLTVQNERVNYPCTVFHHFFLEEYKSFNSLLTRSFTHSLTHHSEFLPLNALLNGEVFFFFLLLLRVFIRYVFHVLWLHTASDCCSHWLLLIMSRRNRGRTRLIFTPSSLRHNKCVCNLCPVCVCVRECVWHNLAVTRPVEGWQEEAGEGIWSSRQSCRQAVGPI